MTDPDFEAMLDGATLEQIREWRLRPYDDIIDEALTDAQLVIRNPGYLAPEDPAVIRQRLEARARELGCFDDPENRTDQQLRDAINAEEAAGEWLTRLEQLPTDHAKQDAIRRLSAAFHQV